MQLSDAHAHFLFFFCEQERVEWSGSIHFSSKCGDNCSSEEEALERGGHE
jgi:hypothetical protein